MSVITTRHGRDWQVVHVLHTLSIFSRNLDVFRNAELLHILTELRRPTVSVCHCHCLASLLVLLDQLTHGVQRQFVLGRLARRIIARWQVLEIDLFKEVVEQVANVRVDRLLV